MNRETRELQPGSVLAAIASVAKLSHVSSLEIPDASGAEDEEELTDRTSADAKLAAVLEVNRMLHSAVREKKEMLKRSCEEIEALRRRTDCQFVEEPVRRSQIEELQVRMQESEADGKRGRESRMMAREIQRLEAKISMLNEDNLVLAEKHRLDRARVVEQQGRLRTLAKRERELTKSLDFLATQLNDEVIARSFGGETAESTDVESVPPQPQTVDYRNLPGMNLNKLCGRNPQREPPSLVVPSGSSAPVISSTLPVEASSLPRREEADGTEHGSAQVVEHEGATNGFPERSPDDSVPEEMPTSHSS
jgi:hypothetical protein